MSQERRHGAVLAMSSNAPRCYRARVLNQSPGPVLAECVQLAPRRSGPAEPPLGQSLDWRKHRDAFLSHCSQGTVPSFCRPHAASRWPRAEEGFCSQRGLGPLCRGLPSTQQVPHCWECSGTLRTEPHSLGARRRATWAPTTWNSDR